MIDSLKIRAAVLLPLAVAGLSGCGSDFKSHKPETASFRVGSSVLTIPISGLSQDKGGPDRSSPITSPNVIVGLRWVDQSLQLRKPVTSCFRTDDQQRRCAEDDMDLFIAAATRGNAQIQGEKAATPPKPIPAMRWRGLTFYVGNSSFGPSDIGFRLEGAKDNSGGFCQLRSSDAGLSGDLSPVAKITRYGRWCRLHVSSSEGGLSFILYFYPRMLPAVTILTTQVQQLVTSFATQSSN